MNEAPSEESLSGAAAHAKSRWARVRDFVRHRLTWNRLYRATSYLKSALWTVPIVAIVIVLVTAPFTHGRR